MVRFIAEVSLLPWKPRRTSSLLKASKKEAGFTLLEIIAVIGLLLFVYAGVLPQLSLKTGTEIATKLGRLSSDIRNAYDLAVLSGQTYRLVIEFNSGNYWLEQADRHDVYLGDKKLRRDPTEEEEKEELAQFKEKFEKYKEQAGPSTTDPDTKEEIPPSTPLLAAEDALKPVKWTKVTSAEWANSRSIGPYLLVRDMQAEHHEEKQVLADIGEKARGYVHFFPRGYVERAVLHIFFKKGEMEIDDSKGSYTVVTDPIAGMADVKAGAEEVDVQSDKEK